MFLNFLVPLSVIGLMWLLADWAVWHSLKRSIESMRLDEDNEMDSADLREGSSIGSLFFEGHDGFEVQEDGTVVGLAAPGWSGESTGGRDDHER